MGTKEPDELKLRAKAVFSERQETPWSAEHGVEWRLQTNEQTLGSEAAISEPLKSRMNIINQGSNRHGIWM